MLIPIEASQTEGQTPLTVNFSCNTNLQVEWNFGDGSALDYNNPTQHTYQHTYTITTMYMVTNKFIPAPGEQIIQNESNITITVYPATDLQEYQIIATALGEKSFQFSHNGPTQQVEWNFGDNCTSYEQSPMNTYLTDGTYQVKLSFIPAPGGEIISVYRDIVVGSGAGGSFVTKSRNLLNSILPLALLGGVIYMVTTGKKNDKENLKK